MIRTSISALGISLLALVLTVSAPQAGLGAQEARDFLFGTPHVTLSVNLGYGLATAGSDLFQEIDTIFTLGKNDFHAPVVSGSLSIFLTERVDLSVAVGYQSSETWSEYRDFVEELASGDSIPIEQKTTLTRVPLSASVRYFLMDRGRGISRFAWVPNRWAPFLGAGGGRIYYRFEQAGDFVDFVDYSIAGDKIGSYGWAWTGHVLAGVQFSVSPNLVLTGEGRYLWADADLDKNIYRGYEPIDLSGFQVTMGIGVRF